VVQRQVLYLGEIKTLSARCGVSRSSALIVKKEGFPLAYEVLAGNTSDKTTLRDFLKKIEAQYGHDISSVSWKYLFSRGEKDRSFKS
jgi:hypothetical protein